jgi:hypothetical protein
MTDKNFELACELADDLYFKFIDSLHDDVANEYVIADEDNIGCTKNTEKGSDLYWELESTIKNTLNKKDQEATRKRIVEQWDKELDKKEVVKSDENFNYNQLEFPFSEESK